MRLCYYKPDLEVNANQLQQHEILPLHQPTPKPTCHSPQGLPASCTAREGRCSSCTSRETRRRWHYPRAYPKTTPRR